MTVSQTVIDQMTYQIGWALIHSVWQAALIAGLLAFALRLSRRTTPETRYVLSIVSLFAVVAAAGVTIALQRPMPVRMTHVAQGIQAQRATQLAPVSNQPAIAKTRIQPVWSTERAIPWFVAAWVFGVLGLSLWQFGGWLMLGRYRRSAQPADASWQRRLLELAGRMGVTRVAMAISQRLDVPIVVGTIRPVILVPLAVLNGLTVQQVEAILAHELAHVRRYDYLANLIQAAIETLLFYHPAVWWISRQIRVEREHCCDELAANACGDRATYARALTALECVRDVRLAPAAGGGGRGELLNRVQRVLGANTSSSSRGNAWVVAMVLIAFGAAMASSGHRLFAQDNNRAQATPTSKPAMVQQVSQVQPEDLIAAPAKEYAIGPYDMVQVSITGIVGPGVETLKQSRVSQAGFLNLPIVGDVSAKGNSAPQLEKAILQAYGDKQIKGLAVSITVVEARNRIFTIYGDVREPGQYAIVRDGAFRLFDALALAKGVTSNGNVHVIRQTDDPAKRRIIEIPGDAVAAGDPKVNIVIYPQDVIIVASRPAGNRPVSPATAPTSAPQAQADDPAQRAILANQDQWDALQERVAAGEALTPTTVQLLLDASERLAASKTSATDDPAVQLSAAEEHLQRCISLSDILFKRRTAEVTRVQLSQVNASIESARARVIRAKARLADASNK